MLSFRLSSSGLPSTLLRLSASTSRISSGQQVCSSHSDLSPPDLSEYRRWTNQDVTKCGHDDSYGRRAFTYLIMGVGGVAGLTGTKKMVVGFVQMKNPSAATRSVATTEVSIKGIAEGNNSTFMWQGKPVFVRHRTPEEIEQMRAVNLKNLREPEHDDDRVIKPEWLIVEGICTHLGCIPLAFKGDYNGYFCPCHGSHYDGSGRIRKGPAPANLPVPHYEFIDDETVIIG